jgi:hypothetical protein
MTSYHNYYHAPTHSNTMTVIPTQIPTQVSTTTNADKKPFTTTPTPTQTPTTKTHYHVAGIHSPHSPKTPTTTTTLTHNLYRSYHPPIHQQSHPSIPTRSFYQQIPRLLTYPMWTASTAKHSPTQNHPTAPDFSPKTSIM